MPKLARDIAERTIVTAAEAALAYLGTRLVDIGAEWVLIGTPILAFLKSTVASAFGKADSASLDPKV